MLSAPWWQAILVIVTLQTARNMPVKKTHGASVVQLIHLADAAVTRRPVFLSLTATGCVHHFLGDFMDLSVRSLRRSFEHVERDVAGDTFPGDQDSFGLVDNSTGLKGDLEIAAQLLVAPVTACVGECNRGVGGEDRPGPFIDVVKA